MVMRLLLKSARRFYLRHPWQLALAIAGISLGVAVYVGVDLANDSARRAFELSSEALLGRTTHRLLPVGGPLPETLYAELVTERGVSRAAPIVEGELRLGSGPGRRYTLLGVDPLKEGAVRGFVGYAPGSAGDVGRLMLEPGAVLLPETVAAEIGAETGHELDVHVDGRPVTISVAGFVRDAEAGADAPAVADVSTAQILTGKLGELDRIDLRLDTEAARALASDPPPGTTLVAVDDGRGGFGELTRAFRTNLTALGLLALVVGMFLIYSTMAFAIVQRRKVMGTLIAVGLDRRQLLAATLLEAVFIGGIATIAGLALGHLLAQGLVDLVLRTIGDLYFAERVAAAEPSRWIYVKGASLGIVATLVAALGPSLDAARSAPAATLRRAALERRSRRRARLAAWWAVPALAAAAIAVAADPRNLYLGFAALFFVLAAGALLTPAATGALMRLAAPAAERGFGLPGTLAVRGVTASLSRTGVATAALAVAVATVIGIGLMISSFRASLVEWLDTTLTADLYVSLASAVLPDGEPVDAILDLPGVAGVSMTRFARLPTAEGEVSLRAVRPGPDGWGLELTSGGDDAYQRLERGPAVAVSEAFAFQRRLDVGGTLTLPTPGGTARFPIVAVYRDYNTGSSAALMSLESYARIWGDDSITSLGVHIADNADPQAVEASLARLLPASSGARIRSTSGLVDVSLAIFDRTFKITEVLRILAASIAFLGVLSALLSIQLEKGRENAVLRAIGFSARQLGVLTLTQTFLLGLAAGLAAMPVGAALAALLVHVINRRSFGWSMELVLSPGPLLSGLALAVGAALLAGVVPALRTRRLAVAGALREE
ncbi:MAG: ABC transporter permease [Gammaproteobacteria bacterium]|nr:ABC transporter permease [Gammaproteobacteria bacterium]